LPEFVPRLSGCMFPLAMNLPHNGPKEFRNGLFVFA
jgi:hypothetical protein